ncbi:DUF3679 domain-containing protein [Thalassobacillus pellis]|uniref:DUF3679 domain-containing protein n=1 Tax=Thalassobacillus pellis TaxID=748008 RepID=UPI0019621AE0|nr:DUF3679 domain-containing protein [Thalassobacillus pellis]MBM7554709.1 putative membrane protein [Thalassobacillus pellis]
MVKYIMFILVTISLFLFGVLFGINQASEGVVQTRGYTTDQLHEALVIKDKTNDTYDVTVMGVPIEQHSVEEKLHVYKSEAAHSSVKVAEALGTGVTKVYDLFITTVAKIVEPLFET